MPPFNLPMVLGTDIAQVSRFRKPDQNWVGKMSRRILTAGEIINLSAKFPPWYQFLYPVKDTPVDPRLGADPESDVHFLRWLAGRWAAKEAARKAWGTGLVGFKDVGVVYADDGKPSIRLLPHRHQGLKDHEIPAQYGCLSLSHDGDYAIATVIAAPMDSEIEKVLRLRADKHREIGQDDTETGNKKADLKRNQSHGVIANRQAAYKRLSKIIKDSKITTPETVDENARN